MKKTLMNVYILLIIATPMGSVSTASTVFSCICDAGYTGRRCNTQINECQPGESVPKMVELAWIE